MITAWADSSDRTECTKALRQKDPGLFEDLENHYYQSAVSTGEIKMILERQAETRSHRPQLGAKKMF